MQRLHDPNGPWRTQLAQGPIGSPMRPLPGDGVEELADVGDKFGGGLEGGEVAAYRVLLPADDGVGHLREAADGAVTLEVRDGGRHSGRRGLAAPRRPGLPVEPGGRPVPSWPNDSTSRPVPSAVTWIGYGSWGIRCMP